MEFSLLNARGAWRLAGVIMSGDWDKHLKRNRRPRIVKKVKRKQPNEEFVESFVDHIYRDIPISETSWYKKKVKKAGSPELVEKQAKNIADKLTALCNDIEINGFHAPKSLFSNIDPFSVCIDRNGEFIYMTGKHRYTVAKILAEKDEAFKMPIRVAIRHAKWQAYRDEVYERIKLGKLVDEDLKQLSHPDLQDLIKK